MRARAAVLLGMGLVGCATHHAPVRTKVGTDLPPAIEAPRETACTFTARQWPNDPAEDTPDGYRSLRFGPGASPFAKIYEGENVELRVLSGLASAGAYLTLDAEGVTFRGHIEAAELPLHPKRPFVVGGVVVPTRRLAWRAAKKGALAIAADVGPRLRATEGTLVTETACDEMVLGYSPLDATAIDEKIGAVKAQEDFATWLRPGKVFLSTAPEADPVAWIDVVEPPDDTLLLHPVRKLATEKTWTRIAMRGYGGVVFGWVRSGDLRTLRRQYADLSHDVASIVLGAPPKGEGWLACAREVPLMARVGEERRTVGVVRAGAMFRTQETASDFTRIELRDSGVMPAPGAAFFVPTSSIATCHPVP
jgi:hypothetical protein